MFIINIFHINVRNFHNNDRPNKTANNSKSILNNKSQYENFGKENNKITSKKNARILKRKGKKKRDNFYCVFCLP